jgi:hypothetical protein
MSATELVSRPDDELYAINQRESERGDQRSPKLVMAYLDDWAAAEIGWLNRTINTYLSGTINLSQR